MLTRFHPLLIALMASAMSMPVVAEAAAKHAKAAVKSDVAVAPETLDPVAELADAADVNGDMTAGAETDAPQTLFDAMRFAYDGSSSIRAARAQLLAVQEDLPQAQAGWKPTATATAGVTKTAIDGSSSTANGSTEKDLGVSVNQPLYRGGRTLSGIENAKNTIMAQRALLNATEAQVLLDVVTAYMNVLRDQSLLGLADNNQEVIGKQLDASKARFEVGDVTRTDVSQAQARLADAQSGKIAARGNLQSSIAVYVRVVGTPPGRLSMPKMNLPVPETLDDSIVMAENYNPSVIAAKFIEDAALDNIDLIHGELLPNVGLVGAIDHAIDPSPGLINHETVKSIGVSASIPLYEAGSVRSRVRQAKDTASQRLIEVKKAQNAARELTVTSWETWQAAQAEIQSRKAQVAANAVARDGVHKEAELGTRTILDALNADQELLNSRSALVTARRDEVVTRFTLASALGLMTPDILGFPELKRDYNEHIREISGKVFSTSTQYGEDGAKIPPQKP